MFVLALLLNNFKPQEYVELLNIRASNPPHNVHILLMHEGGSVLIQYVDYFLICSLTKEAGEQDALPSSTPLIVIQ